VTNLVSALAQVRGGPEVQVMFQSLALRKAEALSTVKERLRTGTGYERFVLTKFLQSCPWPEALPELVALAGDATRHWLPRQGALYALAALGDRAAGPAVAAILHEPDCPPGVQLVAIAALARMDYREAAETIRGYTQKDDVHLRLFATRALAEWGEPVDQALLTAALQSNDYIARQEACEVLAVTPDSAERLKRIARDDPHEAVRDAANRALLVRQLRGQTADAKAAALRAALPGTEPLTAAWIVRTMLAQGGPAGRAAVEELATHNDRLGERSRAYLILASGK
jgi:HEAT repeat protein